jgi:guanosine-3',5'-bis(diphosphate) 3'-pyrophosphohydrolase
MAINPETASRPLLEAVAFAARAHQGQLRKDGRTPYVSHVFRVGLVLREVFGIDDRQALVTAILHDTVEDTTTDFDDLEEKFGREVAAWVAALSKDKRRPEGEREQAYIEALAAGPWQVQACKLADVFDNLMDSVTAAPQQQQRAFRNAHRYLDALQPDLPPQAHHPWEIVCELLTMLEGRSGGP